MSNLNNLYNRDPNAYNREMNRRQDENDRRLNELFDEYYALFEIAIRDDLTKYKKQSLAGYTNRQSQLSIANHFRKLLDAELENGNLFDEECNRIFKGTGHSKEFKDHWWVLVTWFVIGRSVSQTRYHPPLLDITYLKYIWLFSMGAKKILDYELGLRFKTNVPEKGMNALWRAVIEMIHLNIIVCRHDKQVKGRLPFSEKRMIEMCQILASHTGGNVIWYKLRSLILRYRILKGGEMHGFRTTHTYKYTKKDFQDTYVAAAKYLTLAYCEQIQRHPSFSWQKIKELAVLPINKNARNDQQAIRDAIGKAITQAERKNATRTTARFALERKLDRDSVQKILHLANLSSVDANTPGSSKTRQNNLRKNAVHMRKILNDLKTNNPAKKRQRR